jgi:hypothetical protein
MPGLSFHGPLPALTPAQTSLAQRLRRHVGTIASSEHNTATPASLEKAALYIEAALTEAGYAVRRQQYRAAGHGVRNLEATLSNVTAGRAPARVLVVGAHYDSAPGSPGANDNASGVAGVIELARLLKANGARTRMTPGTEIRFVLLTNEEPPYFMGDGMGSMRHARELRERGQNVEAALILETIGWYSNARHSQRYPAALAGASASLPDTGDFIAVVGTLPYAGLVQQVLTAFRAAASFPSEGLAAPATVEGVTLSDHAAYIHYGYPALMITDTAYLRYPYYHTPRDTPDKVDYASMARVVDGLARALETMAQGPGPTSAAGGRDRGPQPGPPARPMASASRAPAARVTQP